MRRYVYASHSTVLRYRYQNVLQPERTWWPHFHAIYGEYNGVFDIQTLDMIEGDLPVRAHRLVREWGEQYRQELLRMWNDNEFMRLPGLE